MLIINTKRAENRCEQASELRAQPAKSTANSLEPPQRALLWIRQAFMQGWPQDILMQETERLSCPRQGRHMPKIGTSPGSSFLSQSDTGQCCFHGDHRRGNCLSGSRRAKVRSCLTSSTSAAPVHVGRYSIT